MKSIFKITLLSCVFAGMLACSTVYVQQGVSLKRGSDGSLPKDVQPDRQHWQALGYLESVYGSFAQIYAGLEAHMRARGDALPANTDDFWPKKWLDICVTPPCETTAGELKRCLSQLREDTDQILDSIIRSIDRAAGSAGADTTFAFLATRFRQVPGGVNPPPRPPKPMPDPGLPDPPDPPWEGATDHKYDWQALAYLESVYGSLAQLFVAMQGHLHARGQKVPTNDDDFWPFKWIQICVTPPFCRASMGDVRRCSVLLKAVNLRMIDGLLEYLKDIPDDMKFSYAATVFRNVPGYTGKKP